MIDKALALHKWRPILESLYITDEKLQGYAAVYAENHAALDAAFGANLQEVEGNLLPLSLLLFSKLNLQDKYFGVVATPEENLTDYSVRCEVENPEDFSLLVDYLQEKERLLVDEMAAAINEKLQAYNTLIAYRLVSHMVLSDGQLRLVSRLAFKNTK